MRSTIRTLTGPSVLSKTQRNSAVLLRTDFTMLWRSEIHINLKIDVDALSRRRRRFCVRRTLYHIYQGQWRHKLISAHASTVYAVLSIKSKTKHLADCTSNLTYTHPNLAKLNLGEGSIQEDLIWLRWERYAQNTSNVQRTVCTTENTMESHSAISNTFDNDMEKQNPYKSWSRLRRPQPTLAWFFCPVYITSYLSEAVKAICWEVRIRLRHMECKE
jgi:hypothetical protein